ncbi:hypothetical protein D9M68_854020 [compost metagenome]
MRLHVELKLHLGGLAVRHALFQRADDLVVPVLDHAHAQLALAVEIGEDRPLGDAQALGDLGGGGALVAKLGEHVAAHAQDVADALLGLGSGGYAAPGTGVFHAVGGVDVCLVARIIVRRPLKLE